jgi:hypothetical protein
MAKKAKKAKKRTTRGAGGGFRPSSLTAMERYEALSPIMSRATQAYVSLFKGSATTAKTLAATKTKLDDMFSSVSKSSGMSAEETRRAFFGFLLNGWPGLLTPIPISAEQTAKNMTGTWELAERITNGGHSAMARSDTATTRARSMIYWQMVPGTTDELVELQIMWNEENHYPRDVALKRFFEGKASSTETFLVAALMRTKLTQVDGYTVQISNQGEIVGNFGHYRDPISFTGNVRVGSFDGFTSMLEMQTEDDITAFHRGMRVKASGQFCTLNVQAGFNTLSYKMTGVPAMDGDTRTMDVVDNYTKISSQQPLIGGWESPEDYFARVRGFLVSAQPKRQQLHHFDLTGQNRR